MKIAYPGGDIIAGYGENFKPGAHQTGKGFFCNPHSIMRSQNGDLYLFNNNSCGANDSMPTVITFREPDGHGDDLKKIWEYKCTVEGDYPRKFLSGGNALALSGEDMFICMGSNYSKLLIVNHDKKILWSALPEIYAPDEHKWKQSHQYRANIISRKDLERFVWDAEGVRAPQ